MTARILRGLLFLALVASACSGGETTADKPSLSLARTADGRVAIALAGASGAKVRALQAELVVDGAVEAALEDPAPPAGLPIDTVRLASRGKNRAILFAGDERGVALPSTGTLVSFAARPTDAGQGTLRIASAVLVRADGTKVDVSLGPAIALR